MYSGALTNAQLLAMVTAFTGGLVTPKIQLFTGGGSPGPNSVLADFPEPIGSWYTSVAAVFAEAFVNGDLSVSIYTQAVQFNYTGVSPAELITGWVISHGAGPLLLAGRRLDTPISMANTSTSVRVYPALNFPAILAAA